MRKAAPRKRFLNGRQIDEIYDAVEVVVKAAIEEAKTQHFEEEYEVRDQIIESIKVIEKYFSLEFDTDDLFPET